MSATRTLSGAELIIEERKRQVLEEGFSAKHDLGHNEGELAWAAVCYAAPRAIYVKRERAGVIDFRDPWPWDDRDDQRKLDNGRHPANFPLYDEQRSPEWHIKQLVRAGALIAAEIDRLRADV